MKNHFVPYEIAKKLKDLNFFDPCLAGVKDNEELTSTGFTITNHSNMHDFALPLYQQVIDWFRNKHKKTIYVKCDYDNGKFLGHCGIVDEKDGIYESNTYTLNAGYGYYQALNEALIYALANTKTLEQAGYVPNAKVKIKLGYFDNEKSVDLKTFDVLGEIISVDETNEYFECNDENGKKLPAVHISSIELIN